MIVKTGDIFGGNSFVEIINKIFQKNYRGWMKGYVDLDEYGIPNSIAWFVHFDGEVHGNRTGWLWRNVLSQDGERITEHFLGDDVLKFCEAVRNNNQVGKANRIAFQRNPIGLGASKVSSV